MKRKIVRTERYTLPSKSVIGILECGHKTKVRENQKFATCKVCKAIEERKK